MGKTSASDLEYRLQGKTWGRSFGGESTIEFHRRTLAVNFKEGSRVDLPWPPSVLNPFALSQLGHGSDVGHDSEWNRSC